MYTKGKKKEGSPTYLVLHLAEGLDDDGDNQVEQHELAEHDEQHEERHGEPRVRHAVVHDEVPVLARQHLEHDQQAGGKRGEVDAL